MTRLRLSYLAVCSCAVAPLGACSSGPSSPSGGAAGAGGASGTPVALGLCGDGTVDAGEACDDVRVGDDVVRIVDIPDDKTLFVHEAIHYDAGDPVGLPFLG